MNDTTAEPDWTLDKKVPIALILAIVGQTAAGVWWAASLSARVDVSETRVAKLEATETKMVETTAQAEAALAGIKATQDAMKSAIDRIERNIDAKK